MTSVNSNSKFIAAFKKLLKRRWAGALIILIGSIVGGVVAAVAAVQAYSFYDSDYIATGAERIKNYCANDELLAFGGVLCIAIGIYDLFACSRYFKEIYNKRSCDYYFSSPIKRAEYFNSGFLFGFVVNAVSFCAGIAAFIAAMKMPMVEKTAFYFEKGAYIGVFAMLLALLAAFALLLLCAVLAGKKLHYIVLSVIALLSAPFALTGIATNLNYVWGFIHQSVSFAALSPVGNAICAYSSEYGFYDQPWRLIIISAVEIVACYIVGLIVFKRRKAEVAEVSLTGKIVPFFFLATLQISAFMYFSQAKNYVIVLATGIVAAAVVTLVYTAIFYKKAFTKETLTTLICTGLACTVFLSAVYLPGHSFYVKYVPKAEEVESVDFTVDDLTFSEFSSGIFNMLFYAYGGSDPEAYTVKSAEGIEKVIALHEKVLTDEVKENTVVETDNYLSPYSIDSNFGFEIKYHLKNGKTVARQYNINSINALDEIKALFQTEEMIRQCEPYGVDLQEMAFAGVRLYDLTPEISVDGDIYYDNCYDVLDATDITDKYPELLECIIADKAQESTNSFFISNTIVDYYSYFGDSAYDYSDHNVGTIVLYLYSDTSSEEYNDKISKMSWAEFQKQMDSDEYAYDGGRWNTMDTYTVEIMDEDTRTIDYLKSIGIELPKSAN